MRVRLDPKAALIGLFATIFLIIPATYVHEFGHSLACTLQGSHSILTVSPFQSSLFCTPLPENYLVFWSSGGLFAAGLLTTPLAFGWIRSNKGIVIALFSVATYHLMNALVEAAFHSWYIEDAKGSEALLIASLGASLLGFTILFARHDTKTITVLKPLGIHTKLLQRIRAIDRTSLIILVGWFGMLAAIRMLLRSEVHSWIGGAGAVAISFAIIFIILKQKRFQKLSVKVKGTLRNWYSKKVIRTGSIIFLLANGVYFAGIEIGYQELASYANEKTKLQNDLDNLYQDKVGDMFELVKLVLLKVATIDKAGNSLLSNTVFITLIEQIEIFTILMIVRYKPRLLGL